MNDGEIRSSIRWERKRKNYQCMNILIIVIEFLRYAALHRLITMCDDYEDKDKKENFVEDF